MSPMQAQLNNPWTTATEHFS